MFEFWTLSWNERSCISFYYKVNICYPHLFGFFKDLIYLFLERGEGNEKEQERNINAQLPLLCPPLGTWPQTQACALTWNGTSDLWFAGQQSIAEPHRPGPICFYYSIFAIIYFSLHCPFLSVTQPVPSKTNSIKKRALKHHFCFM